MKISDYQREQNAAFVKDVQAGFNAGQERDANGRWAGGGGVDSTGKTLTVDSLIKKGFSNPDDVRSILNNKKISDNDVAKAIDKATVQTAKQYAGESDSAIKSAIDGHNTLLEYGSGTTVGGVKVKRLNRIEQKVVQSESDKRGLGLQIKEHIVAGEQTIEGRKAAIKNVYDQYSQRTGSARQWAEDFVKNRK
jgi:hypothetical protein